PTSADPVGSPATGTAGSPASSPASSSSAEGSAADAPQSPDGEDEQDMELRWQPMPEPAAAPAGGQPVRPPTTPRRPRAAAPGGRPAPGSSQSRHDQRPTGAAHRQGQPTNPLVSELQQRFGSLWWWPLAAVAVVVIVVIIAILTVWFTRLGAADAAWAAGAALVLPPPST